MKTIAMIGAALALLASPAAASEWRPLGYGPPNLFTSVHLDSVDSAGRGDVAVTSAWFRIARFDLSGTPRLIREERYEFRCARGELRLAEWGDYYPTGRLAAAGFAPATLPFRAVDAQGYTGAQWRAACGGR